MTSDRETQRNLNVFEINVQWNIWIQHIQFILVCKILELNCTHYVGCLYVN